MKNRFIGSPPPPVDARHPTYQVKRIHKHGPLDVTFAADMIVGIISHFVISDEGGGVTRVCTQHEPGGCPIHDERLEWSGFIPSYCNVEKKRIVLRLSPKEAHAIATKLGVDVRWKGRRVKLTPTNAGQGKGVTVELVNAHMAPAEIGTFGIERTICLVMKTDHIPRQSPPAEDDPSADGEVPL